jgi:hypothetical protein
MAEKVKTKKMDLVRSYIKENTLKVIIWFLGGGILTISAILNLFTSGSKIDFIVHHTVGSYVYFDNSYYYAYTVDVSIVNNGDKPYFPLHYDLKAHWKDADLTFNSYSFPENSVIGNKGPMKIDLNFQKDLTKVDKIEPDGIATGFIQFIFKLTPEMRYKNFLNYDYLQFTVYDTKEKKWESEKIKFSNYENRKSYSPQSGIETK